MMKILMTNAYKILPRYKGKKMLCAYLHIFTQSSQQTHEEITRIIFSILEMRKLSPGEVK